MVILLINKNVLVTNQ